MGETDYLLTERSVHRRDPECFVAIYGNNPRRTMMQNGSNAFRLSRLVFLNGALHQAVQLAGLAIHFYLTIPFGCIKFDKPGAKSGPLTGADSFDSLLKHFDL